MDSSAKDQLESILARMEAAEKKRAQDVLRGGPPTRLVAVSKTKPVGDIVKLYEAGQRHFGENYVAELISKSKHPVILEQCPDIKWHLIGHLQSNKVKLLLDRVQNLFMIETVHSKNLAQALHNYQKDNPNRVKPGEDNELRVLIQVNSSGEAEKSGVEPSEVKGLARFIIEDCPFLYLRGLMTIGADRAHESGPNPDFKMMTDLRRTICKDLILTEEECELSMGMSGDFEHAIEMGSTNVRVGSLLFGNRSYAK